MRKFLVVLAAILSSGWFIPVAFIAGTQLVSVSLCPLQHCQKTYTQADVASFNYAETTAKDAESKQKFWYGRNERVFPIAVFLPSENDEIIIIKLMDWSATKLEEPSASLMLPVKNSDTATTQAGISVISHTPISQTISVNGSHEVGPFFSTSGNFEYKTDGKTIIPIKSRIVFIGLDTTLYTLLCGLSLTIVVRRTALWWRRKLHL